MKDKTTQWFCWNFLWPVDARRIRGSPNESNKTFAEPQKLAEQSRKDSVVTSYLAQFRLVIGKSHLHNERRMMHTFHAGPASFG
jgi:hypothetical protein